MKLWAKKQTGFTIVELLIVIVVIAILATITFVAYTGIRERAVHASVQASLAQASTKIKSQATFDGGKYPATLAEVGITASPSVYYQYTADNTSKPRRYAITASNGLAGSITYYVSNTEATPKEGVAPGHNIAVWDKPSQNSTPINLSSGVTVDTNVFRTSTASIRLAPNARDKSLRVSPIKGLAGQVITVSFWVRSDANWNGGGNSKIRFGTTTGALLGDCSYQGVKVTWTYITCNRPVNAASNLTQQVTVGNDGSVGNIWIDDIEVTVQ